MQLKAVTQYLLEYDRLQEAERRIGRFLRGAMRLGGGNVAQLLDLNYNEFLIAFSNVTFFEGFCKWVS
uniref:Uncharacterized protein n=1 Tax=Parascaris equorum TaxID=6256 RepID=A0A914RYP3_PAREQ